MKTILFDFYFFRKDYAQHKKNWYKFEILDKNFMYIIILKISVF